MGEVILGVDFRKKPLAKDNFDPSDANHIYWALRAVRKQLEPKTGDDPPKDPPAA